MDLKVFEDNKTFWKAVKPLFSEKSNLKTNITLVDNAEVITDKKKIADILNNFFIESVQDLQIEWDNDNDKVTECGTIDEIIESVILKYKLHPSILKIKQNFKIETKFKFEDTTEEDTYSKIKSLDPKKACIQDDIPVKVLIGTNDIVSGRISGIYNKSKNTGSFPNSLKTADITPIHKEKEKTSKKNYRPVSILPILSKIFERNMSDGILAYVEQFLSPYLFGYRKGYGTQHCLLVMIEMWRKALDEKKVGGAILTDLSKAFDCLNHELLIAKLEAYGFEKSALKFVFDYLKNRKQRTKVNSSYSSWKDLLCGVPQGSILGPLLFNIFMNDIFLFLDKANIANYADDNSIYAIEQDIMTLLKTLETETLNVLNWFEINGMKSNKSKCHLIIADINHKLYSSSSYMYLSNEFLENEKTVKPLGMKIDQNLNFEEHINSILKKGNNKLYALMRIKKYLSKDKLKLIMKTFIESQFNYCPIVWMCHSRDLNRKINKLHERALRLVYQEKNMTFEQLLEKDGTVTIHHRNLQKLAVEMYKVKNNLGPKAMQELFKPSIRGRNEWILPEVRTVNRGLETIRYRGPKTWELVPTDIKDSKSLSLFKKKIKNWKPVGCTCRLCKTFIKDLGYL